MMENLGLGDQSRAGSFLDTILRLTVLPYGLMRSAQGLFGPNQNEQTGGLFGMGSGNDPWGQPGAYNKDSGGFTQPGDLRSPGLFGTGLFSDVGQANSENDNLSIWNEDGSYTYGSDVDMSPSTDDLDDADEASGNAGYW
jgi:hypothetical protein